MATRISIDVDLTLINANGELLPGAVEGLKALKSKGYSLTLWSYGGEEYASSVARKHNLESFFESYATKPDVAIDDDFEAISRLPTVDALDKNEQPRGWENLSRFSIQLADEIDNQSRWEDVPDWIRAMADNESDAGVQSAMAIWNQRNTYIRWPKKSRLLLDGMTRHPDGNSQNCYDYPPELVREILEAGLSDDRRNNAPAILAFQLTGGDRPRRPYPSNWGWTIHHIYDGQHLAPTDKTVPRAVVEGKLFTEAAGLVAVHPLADYVATNVPLLAWLLRWEAFCRFQFDPMDVFCKPNTLLTQRPNMNAEDCRVLTVPAGRTLHQIVAHKVYSCPVGHPEHAGDVFVFAPRASDGRMHNLYRIKERIIANPMHLEFQPATSPAAANAIRAYVENVGHTPEIIDAGGFYRFYYLENFNNGVLQHSPRLDRDGPVHGYVLLRDLLSGNDVVPLQ